MSWRLELAFSEAVAGVFTLDSELDGPDVLSDLGAFAGTYDDFTDDATGQIVVTRGTDRLAGSVQASSLEVTASRPDDPGFWNPNNPGSPLNGVSPGFVPIRPGRLIETIESPVTTDGLLLEDGDALLLEDGAGVLLEADAGGTVDYGIFYGFLRRATWRASTRSCDLYFEDLLFRASRVRPVIASTGPTTTGAAIGLILDAMGWPWPEWRSLSTGDAIDDFSADGTQTALDLFASLVQAERGTVFVRGDGVFVYESRDLPQTRTAAGTLSTSTNLEELESGIDADSIRTRSQVTKTDPSGLTAGTTWTSVDDAAEIKLGRSDADPISSPYVPASGGQALADDLVYEGVNGKPPLTADAADTETDTDNATLILIASSPLQSVFTIDDPLGDTDGDYVLQGATHTLSTGIHRVSYTLTKRIARAFTLESGLDGPDVFRY